MGNWTYGKEFVSKRGNTCRYAYFRRKRVAVCIKEKNGNWKWIYTDSRQKSIHGNKMTAVKRVRCPNCGKIGVMMYKDYVSGGVRYGRCYFCGLQQT